jgi:hypothetical protein
MRRVGNGSRESLPGNVPPLRDRSLSIEIKLCVIHVMASQSDADGCALQCNT